MSYYSIDTTNDLTHHGILGMKWGVRRYQNEDGSLTSAGKLRYYGAGGDRKGYYREKGAAKRYKDVMKTANRNYSNTGILSKNARAYRKWVKEDPKNRTGQFATYELEKATKALGGKKAAADAKYAYEHKRLSKYVNRDGSLTTAGKLKYWDTNKERGRARMQRDINRDKNTPTTSEKAEKKWKTTSDAYFIGKKAIANRDLLKAAVIGRQKDPTKYIRKNASKIGKYARRTAFAVATGRPISAAVNTKKMATAATTGAAIAAIKTGNRLAGNATRAHLGATSLLRDYGTLKGHVKQNIRKNYAVTTTRNRNMKLKDEALLGRNSKSYNYTNNLEKTAATERKYLDAAKKASSNVKSTVNNVTDAISSRKRKRS